MFASFFPYPPQSWPFLVVCYSGKVRFLGFKEKVVLDAETSISDKVRPHLEQIGVLSLTVEIDSLLGFCCHPFC